MIIFIEKVAALDRKLPRLCADGLFDVRLFTTVALVIDYDYLFSKFDSFNFLDHVQVAHKAVRTQTVFHTILLFGGVGVYTCERPKPISTNHPILVYHYQL